jgi:hypothetical protein
MQVRDVHYSNYVSQKMFICFSRKLTHHPMQACGITSLILFTRSVYFALVTTSQLKPTIRRTEYSNPKSPQCRLTNFGSMKNISKFDLPLLYLILVHQETCSVSEPKFSIINISNSVKIILMFN